MLAEQNASQSYGKHFVISNSHLKRNNGQLKAGISDFIIYLQGFYLCILIYLLD